MLRFQDGTIHTVEEPQHECALGPVEAAVTKGVLRDGSPRLPRLQFPTRTERLERRVHGPGDGVPDAPMGKFASRCAASAGLVHRDCGQVADEERAFGAPEMVLYPGAYLLGSRLVGWGEVGGCKRKAFPLERVRGDGHAGVSALSHGSQVRRSTWLGLRGGGAPHQQTNQ